MSDSKLDTLNKYMVGVMGDNIMIMNPPRGPISQADALMFAAWIVTLADDYDGGFEKALAAVRE